MTPFETYTSIDEPEVIKTQLEFERSLWLIHRDKDERADHMDKDSLRHRTEVMGRIDNLLDRLLLAELSIGKGSE